VAGVPGHEADGEAALDVYVEDIAEEDITNTRKLCCCLQALENKMLIY
jgi:hypothetical protein